MENLTGEQVREQVDAIRGDPAHPYNNSHHPGHRGAVAKVQNLYNQMQAKGSEENAPLSSEQKKISEAGAKINALKGSRTFMAAYIKGDQDAVKKMTSLYKAAHPEVDKDGNLVSSPTDGDGDGDDEENNSNSHNRDPAEYSPEVNALLNLVEAGDIDTLADEVIDTLSGRFELNEKDEEFIRYMQGLADPADDDDKKFLCDLMLWIGAKVASQQE